MAHARPVQRAHLSRGRAHVRGEALRVPAVGGNARDPCGLEQHSSVRVLEENARVGHKVRGHVRKRQWLTRLLPPAPLERCAGWRARRDRRTRAVDKDFASAHRLLGRRHRAKAERVRRQQQLGDGALAAAAASARGRATAPSAARRWS